MNNWREDILKEFVANVSNLTLVSDPNFLFSDEKLVQELKNRNFETIEFTDSIEFRFAHESFYRLIWDRKETINLIVILRMSESELFYLPYDLYQAGRKLSFSTAKLFPNLSNIVIDSLDLTFLDKLYDAQINLPPDPMGVKSTMDYILRNVFGIAAETIVSDVELMRTLLRLHYSSSKIPAKLLLRLVDVLKNNGRFLDWDLDQIVMDSGKFFAFIQERWPIFLEKFCETEESTTNYSSCDFAISGPPHLPFDHQDIRVYLDNLFIEGMLNPIESPSIEIQQESWVNCGIIHADDGNEENRISKLFDRIGQFQLSDDLNYSDWKSIAMTWAEISALVHKGNTGLHSDRFKELSLMVNAAFADWLQSHYSFLTSLPPNEPVLLHQIPRCLARDIENDVNKHIALIVIDGLSLDQWITIRNIIQRQNNELILREDSIFAWIPTITSVSRQTIFRGKQPQFFPQTIENNNSEEKFWKLFWEDYGISSSDVKYKRGLGDGDAKNILENLINPLTTKIVGLVINKVDDIMHGMQLGSAGMHNQISQWCESGFLINLINYLTEHKFEVCITSDHGNIEAIGRGRPNEGVIADIRGERVRVYNSIELREQISSKHTFARKWDTIGLPSNYYPLVATGNDAFVNQGESIVGHGGISIEEVIVPFVKVGKVLK